MEGAIFDFDMKILTENNIAFFDILFLFCYACLKQRKFANQTTIQGDNYDICYAVFLFEDIAGRGIFVNKIIVTAICALPLAMGALAAGQSEIEKFDPAMACNHTVVSNGVKWIDGRFLPIEGRAFDDVEHYYDRLPANVTTNVNRGVRSMKHHTAGMQFRFSTDSKTLHFRWVPYKAELAMDHMPATGVSGIDVYRQTPDGKWRYVKTGRIKDSKKGGSLSIPWVPGTPCLVNLPLYNGIRSFALGIDEKASVKELPARRSGVLKPVVFYGTSITHGGCCSRPGMAFPSILGRRLDVPIVNLGFSGSGKGEFEMSEHISRIDASCYVVDCLANMTIDNVSARYEKFVRNLRAKRPGVPIVIAESCDVYCGNSPTEESRKVKRWRNEFVRTLHEKLVAEGWSDLYLLPGAGQLSDDYEGTVDGSHPNDWGMMFMADAFGDVVKKALKLK